MFRTITLDQRSGPTIARVGRVIPANWAWFITLGFVFMVLGAIAFANIAAATVVTLFYVGLMMIVAAMVHVAAAISVRKWRSSVIWLSSGVLYAVAGALTMYKPLGAVGAVTLATAFLMVFSGIARVTAGIREHPMNGWGWMVTSGVISIFVGAIVAVTSTANNVWLLGLLLAVDLILQGGASVSLAIVLQARNRAAVREKRAGVTATQSN